jgi:hypothetical protein
MYARAVLHHLDVAGLQVAMRDELLVGGEGIRDLIGDAQRLVQRDGTLCDPIGERLPLDQLHCLDGDVSLETRVVGAVYLAHAALADHLDDLVRADL